MNKTQLIEQIAKSADLSKSAASNALDATMDAIKDALEKGDQVSLIGFGTFSVKDRSAREMRNPQTGESIHVAASKAPTFKAGKGLKDACNAK